MPDDFGAIKSTKAKLGRSVAFYFADVAFWISPSALRTPPQVGRKNKLNIVVIYGICWKNSENRRADIIFSETIFGHYLGIRIQFWGLFAYKGIFQQFGNFPCIPTPKERGPVYMGSNT